MDWACRLSYSSTERMKETLSVDTIQPKKQPMHDDFPTKGKRTKERRTAKVLSKIP